MLAFLEDQQRADHLHPGRAGLGPRADHDVAVTVREAEPPGAVLIRGLIAERRAGHPTSLVVGRGSPWRASGWLDGGYGRGLPASSGGSRRRGYPGRPARA